jgi:hypothetical protein
MEGRGSKKESEDRIWSIAIAVFLLVVLSATLVYLTFFTTVPENHFAVGDTIDYDVSGSADVEMTFEVTEANGSEFSVAFASGTAGTWSERTQFWFDADNATLESAYVGTETRQTEVGTRPLKHYHHVLDDGAVEDVYMGKDNGVVYQLYYAQGDQSFDVELSGSSAGWL